MTFLRTFAAHLRAITLYQEEIIHSKFIYVSFCNFQVARFTCSVDVWYEINERGIAENGRTAIAPRSGRHDHQSLHGCSDGYVCHCCRSVVHGYHANDRFVCQRRLADVGSGYFGHYGRSHRHHGHRLDYVVGYGLQYLGLRVSRFLHRYHFDLYEETSHRR